MKLCRGYLYFPQYENSKTILIVRDTRVTDTLNDATVYGFIAKDGSPLIW